jgi:tripartite-type tricarboxylate transporter receptor subunit TctC
VRSRMGEALTAALADAKVRQQFTAVGLEIVGNTPEQFTTFQARENARWKQLIETRKITAD